MKHPHLPVDINGTRICRVCNHYLGIGETKQRIPKQWTHFNAKEISKVNRSGLSFNYTPATKRNYFRADGSPHRLYKDIASEEKHLTLNEMWSVINS